MQEQSSSSWSSAASSRTADLDAPPHSIGFEIDKLSAHRVTGRLPVTLKCCQGFGVLHGGVSAMIAQGLASIGAHLVSGFQRIAGIQRSTNHARHAQLGDLVYAEATPLSIGKPIQFIKSLMFNWGGFGRRNYGRRILQSRRTRYWSDGTEVEVDNKYLKANNPLRLINFHEQHLRFNPNF